MIGIIFSLILQSQQRICVAGSISDGGSTMMRGAGGTGLVEDARQREGSAGPVHVKSKNFGEHTWCASVVD